MINDEWAYTMDLNTAISKEKVKYLENGHEDKEAEAMAFITVFSNAEDSEKQALAPMFQQINDKYRMERKEWTSLEKAVQKGEKDILDPYGYGIEMNSPLGKMIN
tara:strand:+ start:5006 stop:5320 length:315 start_codon:yes stop_codon:yes gene_type:complete